MYRPRSSTRRPPAQTHRSIRRPSRNARRATRALCLKTPRLTVRYRPRFKASRHCCSCYSSAVMLPDLVVHLMVRNLFFSHRVLYCICMYNLDNYELFSRILWYRRFSFSDELDNASPAFSAMIARTLEAHVATPAAPFSLSPGT